MQVWRRWLLGRSWEIPSLNLTSWNQIFFLYESYICFSYISLNKGKNLHMSDACYIQDCVYHQETDGHFGQVYTHKRLFSQTTSLSWTSQSLIFLPCSPICIQETSCLLCLCPLYPNFAVSEASIIVPCQTEPLNNQFGSGELFERSSAYKISKVLLCTGNRTSPLHFSRCQMFSQEKGKPAASHMLCHAIWQSPDN